MVNREKFEKRNARQIQHQAKTSKIPRKTKKHDHNELAAIKQKLRESEQEKESLKTVINILKNDCKQASNSTEDKEDHCPWEIIKPKQTINICNVDKRKPAESGLLITNQYSALKDQSIPTVINVDEDDELSNTPDTSEYVDHRRSIKKKLLNKKLKKSGENTKRDDTTLVIGDSLLKGL